MKIRVLGGGWYGCHISVALLQRGHDVVLYEQKPRLFSGASGANPARLHLGFHYPRSGLTRRACLDHHERFMSTYGWMTRGVATNVYAVAKDESQVDFATYKQVLEQEVQFIEIHDPGEYGLQNVEGALLTGERHIVIDRARTHFETELAQHAVYLQPPGQIDSEEWDWTIDCTFCANDAEAIDRYEPCVVGILAGPTDRAVTIMDGQFPSIYPWNPERGFVSITSASLTPISKTCRTYEQAIEILGQQSGSDLTARVSAMREQMAHFWPSSRSSYRPVTFKTAVRAMPKSAADARLVDVISVGKRALRVRAGKIDAIFSAARMVVEVISA